jgi:POLQ-like helicase
MNESVLRRFYLTLIIYELWKNSKSIWHVSNEFQLDRGFVQQIIQSSASFTSGVLHFCENLDEFWPYKNLLQDLMKRLQYNCSENELLEIMELDSVRLPRAQQLFNAGFTGIELIAKADAKEMSEKIKNMPLPAAQKLVKSAKVNILHFF